MKTIVQLIIALVPIVAAAQHGQFGTYLELNAPVRSEMPKMNLNGSFGIEGAYSPFNRPNVFLSVKGSLGYYSRQTLAQTYAFDNGTSTTTDVEFTSYMNQVKLGLKCYSGNQASAIRVFVTPQIGVAFMRTRVLIKQPDTESFCNPLERKKSHSFSGFTFGGEAGVEADMSRIFKTVSTPEKHRMYLSVGFLNGIGKFDYVNIRYMSDQPVNDANTRSLTTTFGDQSATIYEKQIAEIYTTKLQFVSVTFGYVYSF